MTTLQTFMKHCNDNWHKHITLGEVGHKLKDFLADEEKMIKDAMMHALDEDGHTGEWKSKFINNYYEKITDDINY